MGLSGLTAVADAGPLIHLAEINCLAILSLFESLHIPGAVWSETVERGRMPSFVEALSSVTVQRHTLSQGEVTRFISENNLTGLHSGEQECLYLCRQIGVLTLLTDDLAVREAAKTLDLTAVGSLGLVVRAYRLGRISLADAEQYMLALYEVSSLFVTRAIVEMAIEGLHEQARQE